MKRRALLSLSAALVAAVISGVILYKTIIANETLGEAGLPGIFLASMLSHLTVVGRGIFGPTFLSLTPVYHAVVLGAFAGWGGAVGEVTSYYLGMGIGEAVEGGKGNGVRKWIDRYGLLTILFLAATPLPDTPIILLAGSSRFPVSKILLVEGVGKTILYSVSAVFGGFLFMSLTDLIGELLTSLLIVAGSAAFCVIVSWGRTRNGLLRLKKKIIP